MGRHVVIVVERMAAGGLGLGRIEGRVVLLPGVLPGEEVRLEILDTKEDYFRAKPLNIIQAHPKRQDPCCPLFMICGGCQLLHAGDELQLPLKAEPALEKVTRNLTSPVTMIRGPFPLFYRDRVRFHLAPIKGCLTPGFYAATSRQLIPIGFCYQLHPRINTALPALAAWLAVMTGETGAPVELTILAGRLEEGLMVFMELPRRPSNRLQAILYRGPETWEPTTVWWSLHGRVQGQPQGRKHLTVLSLGEIGMRLVARPGVFTQVNSAINKMLIKDIMESVRQLQPCRVLDLYAGLGNFSLPVATMVREVMAVEEFPAAAQNALHNVTLNHLNNVRVMAEDALVALDSLIQKGRSFDLVILDPPRAGAKGLATKLARLAPPNILYISCHPAALIRDLPELASLGYQVRKMTVYDMFPQTAHMEVLAYLSRP